MGEGRVLREVTEDDAASVLDLVTLCDLAESGEATYTIEEVTTDIARTNSRAVAVDDPGGGLAAYAWVSHLPTLRTALGSISVRPGGDFSVGPVLLDWVKETAAGFAEGLEVHCFTAAANAAMCRMFRDAGGEVVRRYFRMAVGIDDVIGSGEPAPHVEIRGVGEEDLEDVYAVVETAFADHYANEPKTFDAWRRSSVDGLCPDLGLWWIAKVDGVPAAALYGCEAPHGGWVDTLGTLRDYRGRGLGTALLHTSFDEFRRRGAPKVALSVDATNPTGALGLYTSVGMTVAHEDVRYSFPLP